MGQAQSVSPPPKTPPRHPPNAQIDGGRLRPLTVIYPGAPHDYDKDVVNSLIVSRRLAPFYRGLEDPAPANLDAALDAVGDPSSRSKDPAAERALERSYYSAAGSLAECPICFLNYPPFINYSRCCAHPICTECFVFIRRTDPTPTSLQSEPVPCPFCVEPDFGVTYSPPPPSLRHPPSSSSSLPQPPDSDDPNNPAPTSSNPPRRKSISAASPQVVTVDMVHPDWQDKLNAAKAAAQRRANRRLVFRTVGDRVVPVGIASSSTTSRPHSNSSPPERPSRRNRASEYGISGADLEELMIMEAIRLSQIDEEERQKRAREDSIAQQRQEAATIQESKASSRSTSSSDVNEQKHKKKLSGAVRGFLQHPLGGHSSSSTATNTNSTNNNYLSSSSSSPTPTPPPPLLVPLPASGPSSVAGSPMHHNSHTPAPPPHHTSSTITAASVPPSSSSPPTLPRLSTNATMPQQTSKGKQPNFLDPTDDTPLSSLQPSSANTADTNDSSTSFLNETLRALHKTNSKESFSSSLAPQTPFGESALLSYIPIPSDVSLARQSSQSRQQSSSSTTTTSSTTTSTMQPHGNEDDDGDELRPSHRMVRLNSLDSIDTRGLLSSSLGAVSSVAILSSSSASTSSVPATIPAVDSISVASYDVGDIEVDPLAEAQPGDHEESKHQESSNVSSVSKEEYRQVEESSEHNEGQDSHVTTTTTTNEQTQPQIMINSEEEQEVQEVQEERQQITASFDDDLHDNATQSQQHLDSLQQASLSSSSSLTETETEPTKTKTTASQNNTSSLPTSSSSS